MAVDDLWQSFGAAACVKSDSFAEYFRGRDRGLGIEVTDYAPLDEKWELKRLREMFGFTAPQSWAYATPSLVEAIRIRQ